MDKGKLAGSKLLFPGSPLPQVFRNTAKCLVGGPCTGGRVTSAEQLSPSACRWKPPLSHHVSTDSQDLEQSAGGQRASFHGCAEGQIFMPLGALGWVQQQLWNLNTHSLFRTLKPWARLTPGGCCHRQHLSQDQEVEQTLGWPSRDSPFPSPWMSPLP